MNYWKTIVRKGCVVLVLLLLILVSVQLIATLGNFKDDTTLYILTIFVEIVGILTLRFMYAAFVNRRRQK